MGGGKTLSVDAGRILITLLVTQLTPLCIGLFVRQWRPALAARLQKPFNQLSKALNLSVLGFILVVQFHVLTTVSIRGYAGMIALLILSLAAGWLLSESGNENRKSMALTTSVRNVSLSLVIATGSFPGSPAVTAVLVYGIFQTIASALLALGWGRLAKGPQP